MYVNLSISVLRTVVSNFNKVMQGKEEASFASLHYSSTHEPEGVRCE